MIAASIVCYALDTVAADTVARFGTDKLIYGSVFVMYGLLRYLALTRDPLQGSNPGKMLLKDNARRFWVGDLQHFGHLSAFPCKVLESLSSNHVLSNVAGIGATERVTNGGTQNQLKSPLEFNC